MLSGEETNLWNNLNHEKLWGYIQCPGYMPGVNWEYNWLVGDQSLLYSSKIKYKSSPIFNSVGDVWQY